MRLVFLGTGTSSGVPQIGCDCLVCKSKDARNKRTRAGVLIENGDTRIVIDTSPEFRLQCIREGIRMIDGVVYTHSHADHIFGLDDVRAFTQINKKRMPVFANSDTLSDIKKAFGYIFRPPLNNSPIPLIDLNLIDGDFSIGNIDIKPIDIRHGKLNILAFKINSFMYCTDCNFIPEESKKYFYNLDVLVLGALRYEEYPTHFNFEQAIEIVNEFQPKQTFFTHMSHHVEHGRAESFLQNNIKLAYDGLAIEI